MSLQKDDEEKRRHKTVVFGATDYAIIYKSDSNLQKEDLCDAHSEKWFSGDAYFMALTSIQLGSPDLLLLTVKSDDPAYGLLQRNAQQLHIPLEGIPIAKPTAHRTEFHGPNGDLPTGVIERAIYKELSIRQVNLYLQKIKNAEVIITDSNFQEEIYAFLSTFIAQNMQDVYVKISTASSASNILPLLNNCKGLFGTVLQLNSLAKNYDESEKGIWRTLEILSKKGTEAVFAMYGNKGVYALVKGRQLRTPALVANKALSTQGIAHGTIETFAATVIHSMRKGVSPEQAIKNGLIAADLRKQNKEISELAIQTYLQQEQAKQKITKTLLNTPQPILS